MRSRPIRIGCALSTAVAMAIGIAACGSEISGTPVRVQPDMSRLDVGNYQSRPRTVGNARSEKQARARESQRLGDFVALPFEADPAYVEDAWFVRPHIVLNRKTLGNLVINDTFDDVAADLVAGWVNAWSTGGDIEAPRRTLDIAVLMFPDAATAKSVGPTLEHDDSTYNRDNEPVTLTRHPDSAAHWRPGIGSIGSWTVHDRYVIFIKVVDDISGPDLPALTDQVERMLDVQIPLLDKFQPTPAGELSRIPLDPPGLLGRTLPSDPESPFRPEPDGLYGGRGALSLLRQSSENTLSLLEKSEIDLVSFGDAVVFRSRSAKGADALWQEWRLSKDLESNTKIVDAPAGLTDNTECMAEYIGSGDNQTLVGNLCMMRVDRYIVQSRSKQLPDLHQKMSAQYALLTSG
ncbi:hypothetical protein [Nocardia sp. NPDC005366]|uniref:DUF7373 family lipoprotein n=1 Tax=Nocardia sp. NPDC005366 TaxID=3156878 RepID=UPI0033AF6CA2